jgi:hypothetical protein
VHRFIDQGGDGAEDSYTLDWILNDRLQDEVVRETVETLFGFKARLGNVVNLNGLGAVAKRFTGMESSRSGRSIVPSKRLRG